MDDKGKDNDHAIAATPRYHSCTQPELGPERDLPGARNRNTEAIRSSSRPAEVVEIVTQESILEPLYKMYAREKKRKPAPAS